MLLVSRARVVPCRPLHRLASDFSFNYLRSFCSKLNCVYDRVVLASHYRSGGIVTQV
jgi:hypothetical protein